MQRTIGRWLIVLIAAPLLVALLSSVAGMLEKHRGHDSKSARGVRGLRSVVRKAT